MNVEVNKTVESWISKKFISSVLAKSYQIIRKNKKINELSVALVDAKTIKQINYQYRKVDQVTDVLSFDDPAQIIICWTVVKEQAQEQNHSQKKELSILLIHGLLHILGYDHKRSQDKIKMEKQSEKAIFSIRKILKK